MSADENAAVVRSQIAAIMQYLRKQGEGGEVSERLEEIRQLEADIEWAVDAAAFCFKSPDFRQRVRILARLESALAGLRKGMRTAPPSGPSRRSDG